MTVRTCKTLRNPLRIQNCIVEARSATMEDSTCLLLAIFLPKRKQNKEGKPLTEEEHAGADLGGGCRGYGPPPPPLRLPAVF